MGKLDRDASIHWLGDPVMIKWPPFKGDARNKAFGLAWDLRLLFVLDSWCVARG
jgi:hypothetical protein